jgi:histone H3/H4
LSPTLKTKKKLLVCACLGRKDQEITETLMAKKKMEPLIIASKAKALLKKSGCNTAGDAFDGLNGLVCWYLEQAAKRAKANGRKTVRAHDFTVM